MPKKTQKEQGFLTPEQIRLGLDKLHHYQRAMKAPNSWEEEIEYQSVFHGSEQSRNIAYYLLRDQIEDKVVPSSSTQMDELLASTDYTEANVVPHEHLVLFSITIEEILITLSRIEHWVLAYYMVKEPGASTDLIMVSNVIVRFVENYITPICEAKVKTYDELTKFLQTKGISTYETKLGIDRIKSIYRAKMPDTAPAEWQVLQRRSEL